MPELLKKAGMTQLLVLINIIVFLLEEASGGSMSSGPLVMSCSMYTPAVIEGHEYYRMLSSVFIHFGAEHLGSNMIALLAAGAYIEAVMGSARMGVLYIIAGLAGNAAVMQAEIIAGSYALSAGASGAVSGLAGAYMVLMVSKRYDMVRVPRGNLVMAAVCILLPGLTDSSISFWAHAGGLAAGAALALIYVLINARKEEKSA